MEFKQKINEVEYQALPAKLQGFYRESAQEWSDGQLVTIYSWKLPEGTTLTEAGEIFREESAKIAQEPFRWDGPNPWKRATRNLTEQGRILRGFPALAEQLRREARIAGDI